MPYEKQNFVDFDESNPLKAEQLKKIEDAILENETAIEDVKTMVEQIPAGADGEDGQDGEDGYTPQRGVDYWTADDIASIQNYCETVILNGEW